MTAHHVAGVSQGGTVQGRVQAQRREPPLRAGMVDEPQHGGLVVRALRSTHGPRRDGGDGQDDLSAATRRATGLSMWSLSSTRSDLPGRFAAHLTDPACEVQAEGRRPTASRGDRNRARTGVNTCTTTSMKSSRIHSASCAPSTRAARRRGRSLALDLLGDAFGLAGVGAGHDHEEVGPADGVAHRKDDDVVGLFVAGVAGDVASQFFGRRELCLECYGWSFGSVFVGSVSAPTMTTTVSGGTSAPSRTTPRPSIARMSWATGRARLPARICVCR